MNDETLKLLFCDWKVLSTLSDEEMKDFKIVVEELHLLGLDWWIANSAICYGRKPMAAKRADSRLGRFWPDKKIFALNNRSELNQEFSKEIGHLFSSFPCDRTDPQRTYFDPATFAKFVLNNEFQESLKKNYPAAERNGFWPIQYEDGLDPLLDEFLNSLPTNLSQLPTETTRLLKVRLIQSKFRADLMDRYKACAVSGLNEASLLRAAHIQRWADCRTKPEDRRNVENGLLLSANIDCLFENGHLSFSDEGKLILSTKKKLQAATLETLQLSSESRLSIAPSPAQAAFLKAHRIRHKFE